MTIPVGITQIHHNFGVQYARLMAVALLGALPVVAAYQLFQRRMIDAVMLSSGITG